MNKITPFLTFNHQAEAAMLYYTSVFKQSKVLGVNRYGKGAPAPEGSVMTASFELNGTVFTALNAGPGPYRLWLNATHKPRLIITGTSWAQAAKRWPAAG
jgi:predicted 3-demethylubiquinone-9 3-methyltransferase (glyoxalase superfamily)